MIRPLQIGSIHFPTNLIQAPLAGVSCAPFRELVWQFGSVAYCCTEMLSAKHLAHNIDRSPRYHTTFAGEGPLCWQLSGNQPDDLANASSRAIALGAALLDLNCGCPQPKIRKKGCGSKLLTEEKQLRALINAMRQNPEIPVTVKMRVDGGQGEFDNRDIAQMIEQSGADAIIVHGRSWAEDYNTPCQLDSIADIVTAVTIPVIGNGDIENASGLKQMFVQTRCAGVMIARASVGQPWLFAQLTAELQGHAFAKPSRVEIGRLFLKHAQGLVQLDGERNAIQQCRKFGKYYARDLTEQPAFLTRLYQSNTYPELVDCVEQYFQPL